MLENIKLNFISRNRKLHFKIILAITLMVSLKLLYGKFKPDIKSVDHTIRQKLHLRMLLKLIEKTARD